MTLTIDKFGRIVIPKALRKSMNLEPGDELLVELIPDAPMISLTIKPKRSEIKIEYTDWGFPTITGGEPYPEDFDFQNVTKSGYEEYHKTRFGV